MIPLDYIQLIKNTIDGLSDKQSYNGLFHQHKDGEPIPSAKVLHHIVELARAIIFPGYFGNSTVNSHTIHYHIGVEIENLLDLLVEQIQAGLCFCEEIRKAESFREEAALLAARFIQKLPELRRILATDVEAATMETRQLPVLEKLLSVILPHGQSVITVLHTNCIS